jgi:hypothetical protein
VGLYQLSKDPFYQQAAYALAAYFDTQLYKSAVGAIYKTNSAHPNGYYRVDLALEAGCALIQAGTTSNQPGWVNDGQHIVQFVYNHAYLPTYHVFLFQMDGVVLPDGAVNPDEPIFRGDSDGARIEGGSVKLGEAAQEILALLHVYVVTHDQTFLTRATDLLTPLSAQSNTLGLWDSQYLGYFAAAIFPGPDAQHPGTPLLQKGVKESGRQMQMLEAFRVANSLSDNRYQAMQDELFQLSTGEAYYAAGHGVLFEATADWKPLKLKNGELEDWVTTEAMGITLEGILSVSEPNPW